MTGHLIHVGFPKAASHVLRRWFAEHPQLAYVESGIAGYRNVYQISQEGVRPRPGILYRVTSSESLSAPHIHAGEHLEHFDRAPWTGLPAGQAAVCASLAAVFPAAHVLLVTRGFRPLILSSYSEYVRSGTGLDFPGFCDSVRETILAADIPWDYDHVARLYAAAFGAANLIALPVELLRDDAEAFVRVIETRLGLAHHAPTRDRLNPSLSGEEMYWYPRLTRRVRALPGGRYLWRAYLRGMAVNRFRRPIALLQWLRPGTPVTHDLIPDELVQAFRGKADCFRGNPLYAPYASDYLL